MEKREKYETPEVKVWEFEEVNMASDSTGLGGIDDGGRDEFE